MKKEIFEASRIARNNMNYLQYEHPLSGSQTDFFVISEIPTAMKLHPEAMREMHTHNFYLIICLFTGEGLQTVDFNDYQLEDNTIFFLSPKNLHSFKNSNNCTGFCISFSENFLLRLSDSIQQKVRSFLFNPPNGIFHCKVGNKAQAKIHRDVQMMKEEFAADAAGGDSNNDYLASLLSMFFLDCERLCEWGNDAKGLLDAESFKTYQKFLQAVESHYTEWHEVKDYTKALGISAATLTMYTQKYAGLSPLKMINARIILEAKRMSRYTPLRIKEIAQKLGFNDPSYFNKFFKRKVGVSPADFREID